MKEGTEQFYNYWDLEKMVKSLEFQPSPFCSLSYIFIPEQFMFLNTYSINFHFANFLLLLYLIVKIVNITISLIITTFMIALQITVNNHFYNIVYGTTEESLLFTTFLLKLLTCHPPEILWIVSSVNSLTILSVLKVSSLCF